MGERLPFVCKVADSNPGQTTVLVSLKDLAQGLAMKTMDKKIRTHLYPRVAVNKKGAFRSPSTVACNLRIYTCRGSLMPNLDECFAFLIRQFNHKQNNAHCKAFCVVINLSGRCSFHSCLISLRHNSDRS